MARNLTTHSTAPVHNYQRVGYIRVSSIDQNPGRQLAGIELDRVFEEKLSGRTQDRPGLKEMLAYVREGDHVMVHSMDRLARNLADLKAIVSALTSRQIKVQFIQENLLFTGDDNPVAVLMLSIMGAMAEFEHALISERQREGIELAKRRGVYSKKRSKKLSDNEIEAVRHRVSGGEKITRLAAEYKVTRKTIYNYLARP